VYCFSSSVDRAHFGQALTDIAEPADQAALPYPRLGFFGVIDERLDLPLIDALAEAHPEWQIVIVGPVVKIDPASLPQRANIHYTGQRTYAQLPAYLAGWDVCLLPFARNDATRFISPTKTLEYMAAERPIVSTPITDVAEPYGDIVYLGDTPAAFIAACERALAATPEERAERIRGMRRVLSQTSWDTTAQAMEELIEQAVTAQSARALA
jgi:UDP-galactopyranose mutase